MSSNWKTTVAGFVGGLLMGAANYSGERTWQGYVACLVPVALGILAKDFNTHSTETEVVVATVQANTAALDAANSVK
jgi:hypothetical protein